MKHFRLLAGALACTAILAGCSTSRPLFVPPEQNMAASLPTSEVRSAIITAALSRQWRIVSEEPGVITLAYPSNARSAKYELTVVVHHADKSYKIDYARSRGLDEKVNCEGTTPCVHRNVNRWIANLNQDIKRELAIAAVK